MFGIRFLVVLIAVIAVILIARRLWRRPSASRPPRVASSPMVRCAYCGLYLPKEDALEADGEAYCSPDHRDRHLTH